MAQKIYNNGSDGKILMSSAGKVIRQPYEFGNAFQNRMGLNNYISFPSFGGTNWFQDGSLMLWAETEISITSGPISIKTSANKYTRALVSTSSLLGWFNNGLIINGSISDHATFTHSNSPFNLWYLSWIGNTSSVIGVNGTYSVSRYLTPISTETITDFSIGRTNNISGIPTTPTVSKISRLLLYNRNISLNEIIYYYNNKVGSEPQTLQNIYIDVRCNIAEILNTGGADFVGVRDYSGNNHHGQIMNLPAGTLEEQLTYANANLFVPFLS